MNEFKKDGNFYRVKSKHITHKYNITPLDKKSIDQKLKNQKDFLKNNHIVVSENSFFSLFDISMGANIHPNRYLGEVSNRVDSIKKFSENKGFTSPVFLTMTPNTHFKPCRVVKTKKEGFYILDDNKHFTGDYDNYVKDCRDNIQDKFRRFLRDRIFSDIKKKYNSRVPYFSSYEPSLDGALHKHSLFFVPPEFVERFTKRFHFYFGDVQRDIKTTFDHDVGGVSAYIMKYILKSFKNAETGEMSDEGYWYAKHGLMRFTSSRTMLPLYVWRSIRSPELSYLKMTQEYHDNFLHLSVIPKHDKVCFEEYKRSNYKLAQVDYHQYDDNNDYIGYDILYQRSKDNYDIYTTNIRYGAPPEEVERSKKSIYPVPVVVDGKFYEFDGENLKSPTLPVPFRRSTDLFQYWQSLDVEQVNLHHYHYVRNELIKRGLILGNIESFEDVTNLMKF